ncbi:MAG: hrp1 3 [Gammaproteobacteria bacterium]|jgi:CBS domain-containing protein|nr:hrp1 3 [Gammaproteobacteria bacterium]
MSICKFATTQVSCVSEDASLFEATECMKKDKVGAIVVVKNKESDLTPVGMLTDRDIVTHLLADGIDPKSASVKDIVTKDLMTIKESFNLQEATKALKDKGVRRAPIVNEQNKVVGIVSLDDLFVLMADELYCLAEVVKKQKG